MDPWTVTDNVLSFVIHIWGLCWSKTAEYICFSSCIIHELSYETSVYILCDTYLLWILHLFHFKAPRLPLESKNSVVFSQLTLWTFFCVLYFSYAAFAYLSVKHLEILTFESWCEKITPSAKNTCWNMASFKNNGIFIIINLHIFFKLGLFQRRRKQNLQLYQNLKDVHISVPSTTTTTAAFTFPQFRAGFINFLVQYLQLLLSILWTSLWSVCLCVFTEGCPSKVPCFLIQRKFILY